MDGKAEIDISELQLKPSDSCSFSAFRHYTRYRQYNNSIPRIVDLAALANENSDLVKFKLEDFRLFLEQSLQPKTAGIYLSKFWSLIGKIAAKSSSTNEGNNESGHHYEEPRLCSGIEVGDDLDASVNPPASLDARSKSQTASPHQETVAASQQLNIISLLSDSQSDVSNAETAGGKAAGNVNDFPFIIKANKDIESKIDPLFSSAANHFEAYRANLVTVPSIKELAALLRVGSSAAVESHIAGFKKHLAENLVRSRKSRKFAKISDRTIDNFCNDLRRLFKSINRPHGVDRIMDKGSVSEDYGVNESDNIEKTGGGIGVVTNDDFKAFVDKKNPAVRSAYHRFQEYRSSNPSVPSIFELIALHNSNSGAFILHLNSFERHLRENGVVLKNSPHRNIGDKLQEKSVKDIVGRLTFIITSLSQRTNNESSKSDDSDSVENERVEEQLANTNHHSKVSRRNYRWGLANKPTKAALNRFEEYRLSRQTVPSIDELISVYKSEPEMVDRQLDQFRLSLEETGVHLKKGPSWKSGDKLSSTTIISYISNLSRYISLKSQRNGYSVGQDEYSLDDREKEQENSLPDLPSIGILAEDSEILEVHIDLFQKYLKKQSLSKVLVNRHPEEIRKLLTRNAVGGTKSTKSDFAEAIGVRRDSELLKDSEEVNVVDDEDGDGDDNGGPNEMGRETESNKETDLPFSLAEMFNRGGSSSKEKRRMQVALEHYVLFRGRQKNKAPPSMGKLWTEWDSRTNNMFVKKNLANFLQVYFLDNCAQFECVLPRKSVIENLEAIIQCLSYKSFNLETIDPQEVYILGALRYALQPKSNRRGLLF